MLCDEKRPVFDSLPASMSGVKSVGRLDMLSRGMLLLTTCGELGRHLELSSSGYIMRRYGVLLAPPRLASDSDFQRLCEGLMPVRPITASAGALRVHHHISRRHLRVAATMGRDSGQWKWRLCTIRATMPPQPTQCALVGVGSDGACDGKKSGT